MFGLLGIVPGAVVVWKGGKWMGTFAVSAIAVSGVVGYHLGAGLSSKPRRTSVLTSADDLERRKNPSLTNQLRHPQPHKGLDVPLSQGQFRRNWGLPSAIAGQGEIILARRKSLKAYLGGMPNSTLSVPPYLPPWHPFVERVG